MLEVIDGREQLTPVHISRPRALSRAGEPQQVVADIVSDVRLRGDDAVLEHARRHDRVRLTADELVVEPAEVGRAVKLVRPELLHALEVMAARLRRTCERQLPSSWWIEEDDDAVGELVRPLRSVGIYVPGGRAAYPSTVVMAAIPAQVAGVERICVCSPPGPGGDVSEQVLAACASVGITEVYRVGGAQAIAAMAYGTARIRPVEKIVGPGNVYVTLAKRLVQSWVGVDTEAGPTELVIVADETADPDVLALDLVAQAEHGPNGSHVLITWSADLADAVSEALELRVLRHERAEDVENALIEGGKVVLVRDPDHAFETANAFAPEHLQLSVADARAWLDRVRNAGAVFLGPHTPVPIGDYVAGTNHVLPTGGAARCCSGLSVRDFVKTIYVAAFQ